MICPKCSATALESQSFCSNCGYQLTPQSLTNLGDRLTVLEGHIATSSKKSQGAEQRFLELETSERVVARVMNWAKLFAFWVGIPWAAILLLLGMIVGKGELDLRSIAANAKKEVSGIVAQAQTEGLKAKQTADEALQTSKQVDADIQVTKAKISDLKSQIESRTSSIQNLDAQVKSAQMQLAAQSRQVQRFNQQMAVMTTAKAVADLRSVYPVFGKHQARLQLGDWLDPSAKQFGTRWVGLNLALSNHDVASGISDEKIAKAINSLTERKYQVFIGAIYTYARTATSAQAISMGLDANSCQYWAKPALEPPCILYFRSSLKPAALEVRDLLGDVQKVPDSRLIEIDQSQLDGQKQELLRLSNIDVIVILNQVAQ